MSTFAIFKFTTPVMLGYIPLGAAYALVAVNIGMPVWSILLASVVVYAGSGQFLLASLLGAGAGLFEIFISSFLLNLRHIFYTMALLDDISAVKRKFYIMFALTDESFALLKSLKPTENERDRVYFLAALFNQLYWISGTVVGIFAGKFIKFDYSGIEFSLIALFVVLSIELFKESKSRNVLILSLILGLCGMNFFPNAYMLTGTLLAGVIILLAFRKKI